MFIGLYEMTGTGVLVDQGAHVAQGNVPQRCAYYECQVTQQHASVWTLINAHITLRNREPECIFTTVLNLCNFIAV